MSPFLHSLASPKGEAAARRRLMRGSLAVIARQWMAAANSPLIRPSATFPQGGRHFLLVQPSCDNRRQRDGIDLRLEGVAAARQDGGHLGTGQDAAILAVGGVHQRLVDEVAGLNVGEQPPAKGDRRALLRGL